MAKSSLEIVLMSPMCLYIPADSHQRMQAEEMVLHIPDLGVEDSRNWEVCV